MARASNPVRGPSVLSGDRLRELRLDAGLSLTLVGAGVGRSGDTIRAYESGAVVPPADIVGRLAHVLACKVDDFYVASAVSA